MFQSASRGSLRHLALATCLAILIAFTPQAGAPQALGGISGQVIDSSGAVVPGATVRIRDLSTGTEMKVLETNASGSFAASGLAFGQYRLEATPPGFHLTEQTVTVATMSSEPVTVQLGQLGPIPTDGPQCGPAAEVTEMNLNTDNTTRAWLDQRANAGFCLLTVIPVRDTRSLFVFARRQPKAGKHLVIPINRPIATADVQAQLAQHQANTLAGVHRLSSSSYLLVFRDE